MTLKLKGTKITEDENKGQDIDVQLETGGEEMSELDSIASNQQGTTDQSALSWE